MSEKQLSSKLRQLFDQLNESLTLSQNDEGIEVGILQRLLVFYGYLSNDQVNGIFDEVTDNAIRQFQHDNALYEDGIVGPHTWVTLADYDTSDEES